MRLFRYCLPVVCLFAFLGVLAPPDTKPKPERTPVLSGNVTPISYDLTIEPKKWDFNGGTADGNETIIVNIHHATRGITMNATSGIIVEAAEIDGRSATTKRYPIAQQITFLSSSELAPGKHTLDVRFIGSILSDSKGFFADGYGRHAHPNLVTLFDAAMARSLFPCFDEPRFRATFNVHILAPSTWRVVSNMPQVSVKAISSNPAVKLVTFAPTPRIPTYQLTLDMGDFDSVRGSAGNTPITVYIRPGKEALAKKALRTAEETMLFYEQLFHVSYPMPKLDIVVGSGSLYYFSGGPGAITLYTENDLNGSSFSDPLQSKQDGFNAIAQPIAEQWFGGIVGFDSWKNAWISTGLGSWAEARAEAKFHPEFAAQFPRSINWEWDMLSSRDALTPLRRNVLDDRDPEAFTSYLAGATDIGEAVVHQWSAFVGNHAMLAAVHHYLQSNAWSTVTTRTFWRAFHSPQAVSYGSAWLNQPGTPVVEVTSRCQGALQLVSLKQMPLVHFGFHDRPSAIWPIPVSISTAHATRWAMLGANPIALKFGVCNTPIVIDRGFRPAYPTRLASGMLRKLVSYRNLQSIDRMRIAQDTDILFRAQVATLPEFLHALAIGMQLSHPALLANSLRYRLASIASTMTGAKGRHRLGASLNFALLPMLSKNHFSLIHVDHNLSGIYDTMSNFPNHDRALKALRSWKKHRSTPRAFPDYAFGLIRYAAAVGTRSDFDWALAHVVPVNQYSSIAVQTPLFFLSGAHDAPTILRIFSQLQTRNIDYPAIVLEIGTHQPKIVADYIVTHAHDIMRSAPPSQQAWTLTDSIVNGAWAGRTPKQWRAFLQYTLSPRDTPAIHDAMITIDAKWARRRLLEAQLAAMR